MKIFLFLFQKISLFELMCTLIDAQIIENAFDVLHWLNWLVDRMLFNKFVNSVIVCDERRNVFFFVVAQFILNSFHAYTQTFHIYVWSLIRSLSRKIWSKTKTNAVWVCRSPLNKTKIKIKSIETKLNEKWAKWSYIRKTEFFTVKFWEILKLTNIWMPKQKNNWILARLFFDRLQYLRICDTYQNEKQKWNENKWEKINTNPCESKNDICYWCCFCFCLFANESTKY